MLSVVSIIGNRHTTRLMRFLTADFYFPNRQQNSKISDRLHPFQWETILGLLSFGKEESAQDFET